MRAIIPMENYRKLATNTNNIVTLVYDGECPMCRFSAQTLRIKTAVGNLSILNARENKDCDILKEIELRQIDLDKTMVVVIENKYYQGADALEIMANLSTRSGLYNRLFARAFRYPRIAKFAYPILRIFRKILLFVMGVKPIGY